MVISNKIISLILFCVGVVYFFSFTGINMGDHFFINLEIGYPLFLNKDYSFIDVWRGGFTTGHLLTIPTLRLFQFVLAQIGFFPNPLFLVQLVNLSLSLLILSVVYSLLKKLLNDDFIALCTTLLFGFSFGFYAFMNGEFHHFSIILLISSIYILFVIEREEKVSICSIFIFCFSLGLLPLYHIENIIYVGIIIVYVVSSKNLVSKFSGNSISSILGLIVFPLLLLISSFVFHFYEIGTLDLSEYLSNLPMMLSVSSHIDNYATVAYSHIDLNSVNVLLRSHLESFSIISSCSKIFIQYSDILFYSSTYRTVFTMLLIVGYVLIFLFVNAILVVELIGNWGEIPRIIRLLIFMLVGYIVSFGIFLCNYDLLSEFFISPVMLHCILLGYVFQKKGLFLRKVFFLFFVLTIVTNVYIYAYPQKVSAQSINKIYDKIVSSNQNESDINVFRVSYFLTPYEVKNYKTIRFYSDENVYNSNSNVEEHISKINELYKSGRKVYLMCPLFLIGGSTQQNLNSVKVMGEFGADSNKVKNLQSFITSIQESFELEIIAQYPYNFGFSGQMGQLALIKINNKF